MSVNTDKTVNILVFGDDAVWSGRCVQPPWWQWQQLPLICPYTSAILHGVTCRKTSIFLATAMRILNLIDIKLNIWTWHEIKLYYNITTRREDIVRTATSLILGIRGWWRQADDREKQSVLWESPGPRKGCSSIDGWITNSKYRRTHNTFALKTDAGSKIPEPEFLPVSLDLSLCINN